MRKIMLGVAMSAVLSANAVAGDEIDTTIDRAAAQIVAAKVGDLRGGFGFEDIPTLVRASAPSPQPSEPAPAPEAANAWNDGLAIAVERRVAIGE